MILQHDNARLYVAKWVKIYLEMLKWEVLLYAPYSPDIALSNYEDSKKWLDMWFFPMWNSNGARKMEKSTG